MLLVPVITIVLTILCSLVLFGLMGKNPGTVLYSFFIEPFMDSYNRSEVLLKAAPLILIAQGLAIGFRARVWNIGAEGQLIIGAICASLIPILWPDSVNPMMLPVMIVIGALGGAAWAAIAAFLRTAFNANEIIVTLMLNQIALQVLLYAINGPLKDPRGFSFPQSVTFPDVAMFPPLIADSFLRVNSSVYIAVILSIVAWIYVNHSFAGFRLLVGGLAPDAARYAGFSAKRAVWVSLLLSGAAAGLAGVGEIAGRTIGLVGYGAGRRAVLGWGDGWGEGEGESWGAARGGAVLAALAEEGRAYWEIRGDDTPGEEGRAHAV